MGVETDNIKGVFADLDDGGLTDEEALRKIRELVGAGSPYPREVVVSGHLPFTITIDTETWGVTEFEVNYDFPTFDRSDKPEERKTGNLLTNLTDEQIEHIYERAEDSTGDWPDPERM